MIRIATVNDIKPLNELIQKSARALSQQDYSNEQIEAAIRYIFGIDTELVDDQTYYAIEEEGEYLACGGWSKRKTLFGGNQFEGREGGFLDPKIDAAKIRAFFVTPEYSRRGLGKTLLNYCETEAIAAGFSKVEMMATLPGVKLYKAFGYQIISEKDLLLPNGISLKFMHMEKKF